MNGRSSLWRGSALALLVLLGTCAAVYKLTLLSAEEALTRASQEALSARLRNALHGLPPGGDAQARACAGLTGTGARWAVLWGSDGEPRCRLGEVPQREQVWAEDPMLQAALAGRNGADLWQPANGAQRWVRVALPLREGVRVTSVLEAGMPLPPLDPELAGWKAAAVALAGALVLGTVLVWRARRRLTALRTLEQALHRRESGGLGASLLSAADIGELQHLATALARTQAEWHRETETLRRQLHEQRTLLASMGEALLAVNPELRVLEMNRAAERLFGVSAGQAAGRLLLEVVRNSELSRFAGEALAATESLERELTLSDRQGMVLHATSSTLNDDLGKRQGVLIVLNDITRLRRLESVRTEFVANVSHELKTPVTAIKGFVETLLEEGLADQETARRFLGIVQRQAERLHNIIEDLLNLSRIEQEPEGGLATQVQPIRPILAEVLRACEEAAKGRYIALSLDCAPDLRFRVNGPLIEQAVVNLVDNAVKYSPEGGQVTVRAEADVAEQRILVVDRGMGIPPEHLERLFERFYRVDKARSRKQGGTGLGLSIVKHIAQAHGGRVSVTSTQGRGSTFVLHLPLPEPEEAPDTPERVDAAG